MEKELRELVYDLDFKLGNINLNKGTLNDISDELGHLREDMDTVDFRNGDKKIHYEEVHHKVRMLDDLIHYVVKELNQNYDKTQEIKHDLFIKVVKNEKQNN